VVLREDHPPTKVYQLNREHLAADAIVALADQWATLLQRIKDYLAEWNPEPVSACLFGSAARGEAGVASDIDLLLVAPDDALGSKTLGEMVWESQVEDLVDKVFRGRERVRGAAVEHRRAGAGGGSERPAGT
jgi:predicted nucleotidyltransferase